MKKILYIFILISLVLNFAFAQEPSVSAKLEKSTITIGDQIKLNLQVTSPENYSVAFPILGDTITKKVEIVNKSKIDTSFSADKKSKIFKQTLTISSYDSGYWAIPPFEFTFNLKNDTSKKKLLTEAILLTVNTLPVDTNKAIKDIKIPFEAPMTFRELIPYILGGIAMLAVIIIIIFVSMKLLKKEPILKRETKPKLPPHEIAIIELQKLRDSKLWQQNMIKLFYINLTDILRIYIEGRFGVMAMEMTTDEITKCFKTIDIANDLKDKLKHILDLADLAKFAKIQPLPNENDLALSKAFDFVNETKPVAIKVEEVEDKNDKIEN